MEITREVIVFGILALIVISFIAGFIDATLEDRKRRREQAEREALWRRGVEGHNENTN